MPEQDQKEITSEIFLNLYKKTSKDEEIVKISDAPGITIIRKYDEITKYFKDGKKIFVKFYIRDGYINGGVDMAQKNESGGYTTYDSTKPYKHPYTNFFFSKDENITFNNNAQTIVIKRKNKIYKFNVNDFVDLLIKNHLSDRLFWKRKINKLKIYFLTFIFWLIDQKYDWISYYRKVHDKDKNPNVTDSVNIELPAPLAIDPFFKYFSIYRKILFCCIFIITVVLFYFYDKANCSNSITIFYSLFKVENFTIANPILLFSFFIVLSLLHYLSAYLKAKIHDKDGLIYKLHESSLNNSFSLKFYGTSQKFSKMNDWSKTVVDM